MGVTSRSHRGHLVKLWQIRRARAWLILQRCAITSTELQPKSNSVIKDMQYIDHLEPLNQSSSLGIGHEHLSSEQSETRIPASPIEYFTDVPESGGHEERHSGVNGGNAAQKLADPLLFLGQFSRSRQWQSSQAFLTSQSAQPASSLLCNFNTRQFIFRYSSFST